MIGALIGLLAPRIGEKFAKPVAWAIVIVAAMLLLWGAWAGIKHSIISDHDKSVNLDAAVKDRKADNTAAERAAADERRRQYEADQLLKAMDHAPNDPAIADAVERRVAFHKCLGLQQRARENGLEPPRCV